MVISDCYRLHDIIRELETALCIDGSYYDERDYDKMLSLIKTGIDREYHLDLSSYKIGDAELSSTVYNTAQVLFVDNIALIHSKICGACQIARYKTHVPLSLVDLNYLGFTRETLKPTLLALQREKILANDKNYRAKEAIEAIKAKLVTLNLTWEKRILVLMLVSYDLGMYEITAAIDELLYLSLLE